jgi:hypothetical protein
LVNEEFFVGKFSHNFIKCRHHPQLFSAKWVGFTIIWSVTIANIQGFQVFHTLFVGDTFSIGLTINVQQRQRLNLVAFALATLLALGILGMIIRLNIKR